MNKKTATANTTERVPEGPDGMQPDPATRLDKACNALIAKRGRPLVILYYPPFARMSEGDLEDAYRALRGAGLKPEQRLPHLDVLIESYGGDPVAGYRLAQLIRSFCAEMHVLVAEHAYSAATLFSFAAEQVRLAHFAGLSPIDITLVSEMSGKPQREVELATLDSVVDFAVAAREKVEGLLQKLDSDGKTTVDSDILVATVTQVGALQLGKFYRERLLTGHYAEELLGTFMFGKRLDRGDRCNRVITNFLLGAPGHEVHLDLGLAAKWGLVVEGMETEESDLAKGVASTLEQLAAAEVICPWLPRSERMPFIAYYPVAQPADTNGAPQAGPSEREPLEEVRHEVGAH